MLQPPGSAMTARRVALLGAESTGKSRLAQELADHLRGRGLRAVAVPEVLREWCERQGRAPRPEEQLALAQEQERRVDAGRARRRSRRQRHDSLAGRDLRRHAVSRRRAPVLRARAAADLRSTLVTGLDLPWVPAGCSGMRPTRARTSTRSCDRSCNRRRWPSTWCMEAVPQRLRSALQALAAAGVLAAGLASARDGAKHAGARGLWSCEKCSDPDCEHRLFTQPARSARLAARRAAAGSCPSWRTSGLPCSLGRLLLAGLLGAGLVRNRWRSVFLVAVVPLAAPAVAPAVVPVVPPPDAPVARLQRRRPWAKAKETASEA